MASPADYINTVQSMYLSYYGRFADQAGLNYWTYMLNANGGNLDTIIQAFGTSAEATALYPATLSTAQKVTNLYNTLFGRDPDAAGLTFYTNLIGSGQATLIDIAKRVFDGATAQDANMLANKINVANQLTTTVGAQSNYTGDAVVAAARNLMKTVTADVATITAATNAASATINNAATTGSAVADTTAPTSTALSSTSTAITVTPSESGIVGIYNGATVIVSTGATGGVAASLTIPTTGSNIPVADAILRTFDAAGNTSFVSYVSIGTGGTASTADNFTGTSAVDIIYGLDGDDSLSGGLGADTIWGGAGADTINGGAGADTMYGEAGADIYLFNTGDVVSGERIVELASDADNDTLKIVTSTDLSLLNGGADLIDAASTATSANIEQILITSGQTATFTGAQLTGNAIAVNATAAGAANLVVNATAGATVTLANLTFTAFGGNDAFDTGTDTIALNGSTGAETLTGSTIADTITGGLGADIITGGAGNDTIVLTEATDSQDTVVFSAVASNGVDTITGFTAGSGKDILKVTALATLTDTAGDTVQVASAATTSATAVGTAKAWIVTDAAAADWSDVAAIFAAAMDESGTGSEKSAFLVSNGTDTRIYLYQNDGTDNAVQAGEITLVGTVSGVLASALDVSNVVVV